MTVAVQPHRTVELRHHAAPLAKLVLGLTLLALAALLATQSYERPLLGYDAAGQRQVASTCAAPVAVVVERDASTDRTLSADGNWVTGPPCARSAVFRLGLAGFLAIAGGAAVVGRQRVWTAGLRRM